MKDSYKLRAKADTLCNALDESDGEDPIVRAKLDTVDFLLGDSDSITDEEMSAPESDEDIDKLIEILKKEKEDTPEFSLFGDPNWKIADAQIETCEWAKGQ